MGGTRPWLAVRLPEHSVVQNWGRFAIETASQPVQEYSIGSIFQGAPRELCEFLDWAESPTIYSDDPYFEGKRKVTPDLEAELAGDLKNTQLAGVEQWLTEIDSEVEWIKVRKNVERERLAAEETDGKRKGEEESSMRRTDMKLRVDRRENNQCVGWGASLGIIDRRLRRLRCSKCREEQT